MKKQKDKKDSTFYEKKKHELFIANNLKKSQIRQEPSKFKRFWKWVWYYLTFVWVWAWNNVKDCLWLFAIVVFVYSGSVWVFYASAIFVGWTSTDLGKSLIAIGSGVWAWWMSPLGSPFILLCVVTTLGIKALIESIKAIIRKKRAKNGKSKDLH